MDYCPVCDREAVYVGEWRHSGRESEEEFRLIAHDREEGRWADTCLQTR